MPVYSCKVRGEKKPRVVRASSAAQARGHLVEVETMTGEQVADAVADGVQIERAENAEPNEPPSQNEPEKEG